jgi:hypothetical protein
MNFSDNAMTAILLCSYLGISNEETLKPLTMKEWNEFLDNVTQHGEQPSVVIHSDTNFFKETGYNQEFTERMKKLLSRGGAVAFALDELTKKGIDIVTLSKGQMNIWLKQLCQDSQLQYVNGRYTTLPSLR